MQSDLIPKKFLELKSELEQIGFNVIFEKIGQCRIDNKTLVKWSNRRVKVGKVYQTTDKLRIDLDFPVNTFSNEDLKKLSGLPHLTEIANRDKESYIRCTVGGEKYDTIRMFIKADRLNDYDFRESGFQSLIHKIYSANN